MFPKRERVISILDGCIKEMELLLEMSKDLQCADDFLSNMSGMILFRACGMSLQYITESLVKIRNLCGRSFFDSYRSIPWDSVFGMRNFLSHEYDEVDAEGIYNTVKGNIPDLYKAVSQMLTDVKEGQKDAFME